MKTELKSLMVDCQKWLKEFKQLKNKSAHKARYLQYVEIVRTCKAYLAVETLEQKTLVTLKKEEGIPYSDKVHFRCIELVKKFTVEVKGDKGFEFRKDGRNVSNLINKDNVTYTYTMKGYDKAEYDEQDSVSICRQYSVLEMQNSARELEITITFETANQVYVDVKKVSIPPFSSSYEINVNAKWLPKLKIDVNDPDSIRYLIDNYGNLIDRVGINLIEILQHHLTETKTSLIQLTTAYTVAYDRFTKTLQAAKDAEDLKAAWIANVFSIAGCGMLSAFSSTKFLLNTLDDLLAIDKENIESTINILEDLAQVSLDKAFTTDFNLSSAKELELDSPLSFQNDLEKKGAKLLGEVMNLTKNYMEAILKKKETLTTKKQAKIFSLEEEWESFCKIYAGYLNLESVLSKLFDKKWNIPSSLADDLELFLWAEWIRTQQTHKAKHNPSQEIEFDSVSLPLERPIISALSRLKLTSKLGLDFGTFESWYDESEILRKWAKEFQPRPLF
ncbi:hypothetical protein [Aureispira sp. CCB-QB1]|uniref:hypothetical protein n=1 Tax=Aureispira sp. CCB-QB1 TaxID=1313421 RepID=UPI000695C0D0|nr:hypothetical protein [Aureispira sp. CCB-QB1]